MADLVHPGPETLAGLALGDDDLITRRHVGSCAQCAAVVDDLHHVRDLTHDAVDGPGTDGWGTPGPGVWARIEAELDSAPADRQVGGAEVPVIPAGPATAAAPTELRTTRRAAARARRTSLSWLAAAAVAGILVGVGGAWSFWRAPDAPATVASVPLDTLDTQQVRGEAVLQRVSGGLDLRIDSTTLDPGSGYLEVWLLNADGKRMVSLGLLRQPVSTFPVSPGLIEKGYVIVDVSREGFDDRPQHSGDSVVRGRLAV